MAGIYAPGNGAGASGRVGARRSGARSCGRPDTRAGRSSAQGATDRLTVLREPRRRGASALPCPAVTALPHTPGADSALGFLAHATAELARSLDYSDVVRTVARIMVPAV